LFIAALISVFYDCPNPNKEEIQSRAKIVIPRTERRITRTTIRIITIKIPFFDFFACGICISWTGGID